MLEELSIRDYALIERVSVPFKAGLTLLTGETGAGKSILIGAIGFLLGGKADTGVIRSGTDETLVSGIFALDGGSEASSWLAQRDIPVEDGSVIVRRSLKSTGRGAIYIQNTPVTRVDLAEFASLLIDMHGQHEHQVLLRPERHRDTLDGYCGLSGEVRAYGALFAELANKKKSFEKLLASEKERAREIDFLKFAADEIAKAKLRQGEEAELEQEEARLSQFEKLDAGISGLRATLVESQLGVLSNLRKARTLAEGAVAIDGKLAEIAKRLDDSYYELEDIAEEVRHYSDSVTFSPARLEEIEGRLSELQKLRKKYGGSIEAVLAYYDESVAQLSSIEHWEEDRESLLREIQSLEKDVYAKALAISERRKAGAAKLQGEIETVLRSLGMAHARFRIDVTRKESDSGRAVVGQYGVDEVCFMFVANQGEPLRNLADIASGGELSRVMLAVKTAIADSDDLPTLIFDEIDTGIGGEVALAVGQHLLTLAKKRQVLCITHLASIAARADNHYRVEKENASGRTVTKIRSLSGGERRTEVARMLAGDSKGERSLAHAGELIDNLGSRR